MKIFVLTVITFFSLNTFAATVDSKDACRPGALTGSYDIVAVETNVRGEYLTAHIGVAKLKPLTEGPSQIYIADINLNVSELPQSLCSNSYTSVTQQFNILEVSYTDDSGGQNCDVVWRSSQVEGRNRDYDLWRNSDSGELSFYDCSGRKTRFKFIPQK